jgi:hypothetical protein
MAADRQQTHVSKPRFRLLLPPPRRRRRALSISKRTVWRLRTAFGCSLLGTALAVVWTIQCGLESGRASQRLKEVEIEGARLDAAAAEHLALAENELNQRQKTVDDLTKNATKSVREKIAAELLIEQMQPQIAAAHQEVNVAKQSVAESSIKVDRLTRGPWLERKRSQQLLFWSIVAVAVGLIATSATGWVWRRAV